MRLGEAIHSHFVLSLTGISAAYCAADFLIACHLAAGITLGFIEHSRLLPGL
jgi:hypothetical protein